MESLTNYVEKNLGLLVGMISMALVVVVSNILVAYQINDWLTWAAFTYPIAFFVTDMSNRVLGVASAKKVVTLGFIIGVVLSYVFADLRIAIASGAAFLIAQLLDILIFNKLKQAYWWKAPLVSSVLAGALDTFIFFSLAFWGTGVPWPTLATGDYAVKLLMAFVLLAPFRMLYVRFLPQQEVAGE